MSVYSFVYGIMIVCLSLLSSSLDARTIKKRIAVYYLEEEVNNTMFTYRLDSFDSVLKESYSINSKGVNHEEYEESILNAEKEERRKERQKERDRRILTEQLSTIARVVKTKEDLAVLIHTIEELFYKIADYSLESYLIFDAHATLSLTEFNTLRTEYIAHAKKLLQENNKQSDIKALQEAIEQLKPYSEKLADLFYATVESAITKCNDTKVLKKLLTLIPE